MFITNIVSYKRPIFLEMQVVILRSFQAELQLVESQMNIDVSFKSAGLKELIDLPNNDLDNNMCPAFFLAVTAMKSQRSNDFVTLASIFQFVFLANRIHRLVSDEGLTEHERQYPVLVGDFMLGQAFSKLCEGDLFIYSSDFIKLIEIMNEGVLLRWRLKNKPLTLKDYREILGKERASLTALIGKIAAKVSGIEDPHAQKIEDLGYFLGMAWAAWEESLGLPIVQEYLAKMKNIMNDLRDSYSVKPLLEIYEFFNNNLSPNAELASS